MHQYEDAEDETDIEYDNEYFENVFEKIRPVIAVEIKHVVPPFLETKLQQAFQLVVKITQVDYIGGMVLVGTRRPLGLGEPTHKGLFGDWVVT